MLFDSLLRLSEGRRADDQWLILAQLFPPTQNNKANSSNSCGSDGNRQQTNKGSSGTLYLAGDRLRLPDQSRRRSGWRHCDRRHRANGPVCYTHAHTRARRVFSTHLLRSSGGFVSSLKLNADTEDVVTLRCCCFTFTTRTALSCDATLTC